MALAAASAILAQQGLEALSTRKVAKAIGYTVGTLYLVFKNLDELILHLNAATLKELESMLKAESTKHPRPHEVLHGIARVYCDYAKHQRARWSLLFTHQLAPGSQVPAWFDLMVRELFAIIEAPLQAIKANTSHSERARVARALWGGVHGVCELALSDKLKWGEQVTTESVVEVLVENFLAGLGQH